MRRLAILVSGSGVLLTNMGLYYCAEDSITGIAWRGPK